MPTKNDGGPAFPVPLNAWTEGMALRDQFALSGLQYLGQRTDVTIRSAEHIAEIAYQIADAMLAEREK